LDQEFSILASKNMIFLDTYLAQNAVMTQTTVHVILLIAAIAA
jgi:hypothetical protein